MAVMSKSKLAKVLGYSPKTIADWIATGLFDEFLSELALKEYAPKFNTEDQMVFQTIAFYRNHEKLEWEDIVRRLQAGERQDYRRPAAIDVAEDQPALYGLVTKYKAERDELETALDRLREMLDEKDQINRDLNREIGRLEARDEISQEEIEKLTKRIKELEALLDKDD